MGKLSLTTETELINYETNENFCYFCLTAIFTVIGFSNVEASEQLTEKTLPTAIIESVSNYETSAEFQYVGDIKKLKAVISGAVEQLKNEDPYTHLNFHKWQASYKRTAKQGNLVHYYDAKTKKYRAINAKTLQITASTKSKYQLALKEAK